jgi:hypothetical protein
MCLLLAVPAALANELDACAATANFDCNGEDVQKISNTTSNLSQEQCCQLCESHADCKVAVFVPNWPEGGKYMSLCELKSGCHKTNPKMSDRVRVCPPKSKIIIGACGNTPVPTPPPAPAVYHSLQRDPTACILRPRKGHCLTDEGANFKNDN